MRRKNHERVQDVLRVRDTVTFTPDNLIDKVQFALGGFNMRHCCKFDAFDIWYLKDTDNYTNRTLFIGICPICKKQIVELIQKNIKTNSLITIKKVGETALKYTKDVRKDLISSRNETNKMKFVPKPYGWRYGVNKLKKNKDGEEILEQYSMDFFGNSELVKKK